MRRKINHAAAAALARDPKVLEYTEQVAEEVAARARKRAPKRTGAGAESIHVERVEKEGDIVFRVSFDTEHFYMFFNEVGTEKQKAHPFLRPSARGSLSRQRNYFKKQAASNPAP